MRTASDPDLETLVVLRVTLSPDAAHARVAYACRDEARAAAALDRATGYLRAQLAQLNLKKLPQLTFTVVGVIA